MKEVAQESFDGEVAGRPTEAELVTIGLLMRLYDLQLAILHCLDSDKADEVYDHHEAGGHYNPTIFIPQPKASDDTIPQPKSE